MPCLLNAVAVACRQHQSFHRPNSHRASLTVCVALFHFDQLRLHCALPHWFSDARSSSTYACCHSPRLSGVTVLSRAKMDIFKSRDTTKHSRSLGEQILCDCLGCCQSGTHAHLQLVGHLRQLSSPLRCLVRPSSPQRLSRLASPRWCPCHCSLRSANFGIRSSSLALLCWLDLAELHTAISLRMAASKQ